MYTYEEVVGPGPECDILPRLGLAISEMFRVPGLGVRKPALLGPLSQRTRGRDCYVSRDVRKHERVRLPGICM